MGRVKNKLKNAFHTIADGETYERFGNYPQRQEQERRGYQRSGDEQIQELGVLTAGAGAVVAVVGAGLEFTQVINHEIGNMTVYGGLGAAAIGGAIYALGRVSK